MLKKKDLFYWVIVRLVFSLPNQFLDVFDMRTSFLEPVGVSFALLFELTNSCCVANYKLKKKGKVSGSGFNVNVFF